MLTSLADNESIPEFEAFRDPYNADGLRHLQPFPLICTQLQHPFSPQMHSGQTLLERIVQVLCARNLLWLLHLLYRGDEESRGDTGFWRSIRSNYRIIFVERACKDHESTLFMSNYISRALIGLYRALSLRYIAWQQRLLRRLVAVHQP